MILVLGGTAEARELATLLDSAGTRFMSSLAGRVSAPALPVGEARIGGFGGVAGLTRYLRERRVSAVVDATHPFAAQMSQHAADACAALGLPLLRLARPGWSTSPLADGWYWVDSFPAAADRAAGLSRRPFLTTGRQTLQHFTGPLGDRYALVRVVEPPSDALPAGRGGTPVPRTVSAGG